MAMIIGIGFIFSTQTEYGYSALALAIVFSGMMALFSYFTGGTLALMTSGAREVSKEQEPRLVRIVENLCITAGVPMPKVHIMHDKAMNAFTTGRDPKHASIAVTTGLLEALSDMNLRGDRTNSHISATTISR